MAKSVFKKITEWIMEAAEKPPKNLPETPEPYEDDPDNPIKQKLDGLLAKAEQVDEATDPIDWVVRVVEWRSELLALATALYKVPTGDPDTQSRRGQMGARRKCHPGAAEEVRRAYHGARRRWHHSDRARSDSRRSDPAHIRLRQAVQPDRRSGQHVRRPGPAERDRLRPHRHPARSEQRRLPHPHLGPRRQHERSDQGPARPSWAHQRRRLQSRRQAHRQRRRRPHRADLGRGSSRAE